MMKYAELENPHLCATSPTESVPVASSVVASSSLFDVMNSLGVRP